MKRLVFSFLVMIVGSLNVNAADLIVQQNGPTGTYNSISAAVTAAVNGDQIIINNRIDGLPWVEDITIAKTLTFVSAVDATRFWVQGTWTISTANGRIVDIVGMRNTLSGTENITVTSGGTVSQRTKIRVFDSELSGSLKAAPSITNDVNNVSGTDLYLGSSTVEERVTFSFGKLMGNTLKSSLYLYSDLSNTNDTIWVVGNDITDFDGFTRAFFISNTTQYCMVYNNYIQNSYSGSFSKDGLFIANLKNGSSNHLFVNNTVFCYAISGSSSPKALDIDFGVSSNCLFLNNIFGVSGSSLSIDIPSSLISSFHYNMYEYTSDLLDLSLGNVTYNSLVSSSFSSDRSNNFTNANNIGNPSNQYTNLDLTVNTLGVYGGSYSFENFHPINNATSSRVNFVTTPRIVNSGATFRVDALGFDK